MAERRTKKKKKRNSNKLGMLAIVAIVGLMLGVMVYQTKQLERKEADYAVKAAELEDQIANESARTDELEEYRIYVQTKQYIEDIAKSKLGLVYEDEILVKPND